MGIVSVGWRNQGDLLVSHRTTIIPPLVHVATCTLVVRCSANSRLVGGEQPSKSPLPEAWTRMLQAMLEFKESFSYDVLSAFPWTSVRLHISIIHSAGVVRMPGALARTLSGDCFGKSSASKQRTPLCTKSTKPPPQLKQKGGETDNRPYFTATEGFHHKPLA